MKKHSVLIVAVMLALPASVAMAAADQAEEPKKNLQAKRKRLSELKDGMDSKQVIEILGKPDEVRQIPKDHLLDGTQLVGDPRTPDLGPETQRWAYGVLGKGMFAAVGYVSMDRNGKVVAAMPADCFAKSKLPHRVRPSSDKAVETPAKLRCHLGTVEIIPAKGETAGGLKTTVKLTNGGKERFVLKHDAARSIARFLLIEVYDAERTLLFRDYMMSYHAPFSPDPSKWPELTIPPGAEKSEQFHVSPSHGFGRLPAGNYSMRVYFPFIEQKFYPSNLVRFKVPGRKKTKASGK